MLSTEFDAAHLPISQAAPEHSFCVGTGSPKRAAAR